MRLIDAVKVNKTIDKFNYCLDEVMICRIKMRISAIPTVEERPHGKWEYTTHYARRFRVCSVCKTEKEDDRSTGWNFCQYCGSDNRKEGEAK